MKLNIVTDNPSEALEIVKNEFAGSKVELVEQFSKIAVISVEDKTGEECVYSLEALMELTRYFSKHNIRVY